MTGNHKHPLAFAGVHVGQTDLSVHRLPDPPTPTTAAGVAAATLEDIYSEVGCCGSCNMTSADSELPCICDRVLRVRDALNAADTEISRLRAALVRVAAPAPDADALGCTPGFDYWCTVATRRQDIAREALR